MREHLCYTCLNYRKGTGEVGARWCAAKVFDETRPGKLPKLNSELMIIRPERCVDYRYNNEKTY